MIQFIEPSFFVGELLIYKKVNPDLMTTSSTEKRSPMGLIMKMTERSLTQTDGRTTRINFPRNDFSTLTASSTRAANCSQLRLFVQTTHIPQVGQQSNSNSKFKDS